MNSAMRWIDNHTKLLITTAVGILVLEIAVVAIVIIYRIVPSGMVEETTNSSAHSTSIIIDSPTPTPTPYVFARYAKPVLAESDHYIIYLIGDSMTHALGPRGGVFNELLSDAYTGIFFEMFNYSEGNQNIESLPVRMHEPVQAAADLSLAPILDGQPDTPDLIIIESFGYNPLSQFGIDEGLNRQSVVLANVMTTLTEVFPDTAIMFMATIAPDRATYAKNLDGVARPEQAEERILYIQNHLAYAKEHDIPIIDVFTKTLDGEGDGDVRYISADDNIHPSPDGLLLMGKVMTDTIVADNIFPIPTTQTP
jgi:hypothetical protein